jgi:hypothetical protein
MGTPRTLCLAAVLLFVMAAGLAHPLLAAEPGLVGLVVQFGDGRVETRCINTGKGGSTGADVLMTSGLDVVLDPTNSMGLVICQIEGEGCAYPAEPCFCQCLGGGECTYWNYFYRPPGSDGWVYSGLGAAARQVVPGSVEAWVWGNGEEMPAAGLTFESICIPATPTPSSTPEPTAPRRALVTSSPEVPATAPATAILPPAEPSSTPGASLKQPTTAPSFSSGDVSQRPIGLTSFGLVLLGLILVGAVLWIRRR